MTEFLFRLDDLPLESVVFILTELTAFELLLCLDLRFLERVQLFLGGVDRFLQQLLFLRNEIGVAGVEFEKAVDIPERRLCVLDR